MKQYLFLARRSLACLTALFLLGNLHAMSLEVGSPFPEIQSVDQHDNAFSLPENTKWVVVTFTMGDGKKANRYFEKMGKAFLPDNHAVYLANIYGMPSVARVFAMPKMRKYPHRIMLADEKGLLDPFPQKKNNATVFELDNNNQIIAISFWDPDSGGNPFSRDR